MKKDRFLGRPEELESKVSRRNLGRGLSARPRSREDRGLVEIRERSLEAGKLSKEIDGRINDYFR